MNAETWRDIKGYEGLYQVSDQGRIKRIGGGRGAKRGRILRPCTSCGYESVHLYKKQVQDTRRVHRLVCAAFVSPCPSDKHEPNHKNGVRNDNRAGNLEWCTRSENHWHAFHILGRKVIMPHLCGQEAARAKLTQNEVDEIRSRYGRGGITYAKLASEYGVCYSTIGYIIRGDTFTVQDPEECKTYSMSKAMQRTTNRSTHGQP